MLKYRTMKKRKTKVRRKKLEPLARIRRRLMRLWTKRVYEDWGGRCAVCGSESLPNAHHLENRNTCRALRYDPMNGVLLCPSHHKWGKDSAHKGGIWFADWLLKNHPDRFGYVLENRNRDVNLNDRTVLSALEALLQPKDPDVTAKCEDALGETATPAVTTTETSERNENEGDTSIQS